MQYLVKFRTRLIVQRKAPRWQICSPGRFVTALTNPARENQIPQVIISGAGRGIASEIAGDGAREPGPALPNCGDAACTDVKQRFLLSSPLNLSA